jgi:hypothetical protein
MTTFKAMDIEQALTKKGFSLDTSHHKMFWYYSAGKKTSIRTRVSHGIDEYGDSLIGQMARQVGLTKAQLSSFITCTLSAEQYQAILVTSKKITLPTKEGSGSLLENSRSKKKVKG